MNEFMIYLLQVSLSLGVFYSLFWIFLRKETFFTTNRFYLLGSLILSSLMPLFNVQHLFSEHTFIYLNILDPVVINASVLEDSISKHLTTYQILLVIYFTGVGIFSLRFIFQLVQLTFIYSISKKIRKDGIKIVLVKDAISVFSFFKLLFINCKEYQDDNMDEIIRHERIHMQQGHSMDIIFTELMIILLWFNPFVWFYRISIRSIHEYLADQGVLMQGTQKRHYQELLLNQAFGIQINGLANNFNHSLIKRRFIMMTKSKSGFMARIRAILVLPVSLAIVFMILSGTQSFAQEEKQVKQEQQTEKISGETGKPLPPPPPKEEKIVKASEAGNKPGKESPPPPPKANQQDEVFTEVTKQPEFPGGTEAMYKFIVENVQYPKAALDAKVSGTVQVVFIISEEGKVIKPEVLKIKLNNPNNNQEAEDALKKEALRVISLMPKWKPGEKDGKPVKVKNVLPIKFNLS